MVSFLAGDKHKDLLIINRGAECKTICTLNQRCTTETNKLVPNQQYTKEINEPVLHIDYICAVRDVLDQLRKNQHELNWRYKTWSKFRQLIMSYSEICVGLKISKM